MPVESDSSNIDVDGLFIINNADILGTITGRYDIAICKSTPARHIPYDDIIKAGAGICTDIGELLSLNVRR